MDYNFVLFFDKYTLILYLKIGKSPQGIKYFFRENKFNMRVITVKIFNQLHFNQNQVANVN